LSLFHNIRRVNYAVEKNRRDYGVNVLGENMNYLKKGRRNSNKD